MPHKRWWEVKPRKRWWEVNEVAKLRVEQSAAKWNGLKWQTRVELTRLPIGFTCWHFNKKMPIEDRLRIVLPTSMARPKGDWEYDVLEMERVNWNLIRRVMKWLRSG